MTIKITHFKDEHIIYPKSTYIIKIELPLGSCDTDYLNTKEARELVDKLNKTIHECEKLND